MENHLKFSRFGQHYWQPSTGNKLANRWHLTTPGPQIEVEVSNNFFDKTQSGHFQSQSFMLILVVFAEHSNDHFTIQITIMLFFHIFFLLVFHKQKLHLIKRLLSHFKVTRHFLCLHLNFLNFAQVQQCHGSSKAAKGCPMPVGNHKMSWDLPLYIT